MKKLLFIVGFLFLASMAHGDMSKHNVICEQYISLEDMKIPELSKTFAQLKKDNGFEYSFYFNKHLQVYMMTVEFNGLKRFTWQIDNRIFTVRPQMKEMVCVNKIKNGFNLNRLMNYLIPGATKKFETEKQFGPQESTKGWH